MKIAAVVSLALIAFFMAAPAYAYVDPGAGGMLTQLLTGGVAGLLVLFRLYWSRLRESVRRRESTAHEQGAASQVNSVQG
jgi:Zn-dependent protease with chaperone function